MTDTNLKAPFPYFGGKAAVAPVVWEALGQPEHYIEPFAGSAAVLLARPDFDPERHTETINDRDGYVTNAWRAIQADPDAVAKLCDWPVNHLDLNARRVALRAAGDDLVARLGTDPDYYDATLAGYWVWAASTWIGSGLMSKDARPHLTSKGMGVHKGIISKRPRLADKGKGVHKTSIGQIPHLADKGKVLNRVGSPPIYDWFRALAARLRRVRVICGDWSRVCGGDWQDAQWPTVGIFFDPPYGDAGAGRDPDIYHEESLTVAADVRAWCLERGARPNYRIVLAGYEGEHESLEAAGWRVHAWKTKGGYGKIARNGATTRGQTNRHRERLWISPGCLARSRSRSRSLFDTTGRDVLR